MSLQFQTDWKASAFQHFMQAVIVTTTTEATQLDPYLVQLEDFATPFLKVELSRCQGLRVYPILQALYELKIGPDESIFHIVPMASTSFWLHNEHEITARLAAMSDDFRRTNETLIRNQSYFISSMTIHSIEMVALINP